MPTRKRKKTQPKWLKKETKKYEPPTLTPEEYLTAEGTPCPRCAVPKQDVRPRVNLYLVAASSLSPKEATENMCGDCAHGLWLDS